MAESNVSSFTKETAAKWLADLGLACSGTKEELVQRIKTFQKWPKLVSTLQKRAKRNFKFTCSLDPTSIPTPSITWKEDDTLYPKITEAKFQKYMDHKKEGNKGQLEKAHRMLQSRKIVSVKVYSETGQYSYVKGMIKKSYGITKRPAVIFFKGDTPVKANCECPVGTCGLCCHVIALLLYLKHFNETGEKILELTCTQQLQKWHKRSNKGSVPMVKLAKLKLKSAKKKRKISPADPSNPRQKRDVTKMIENIKSKMSTLPPVTPHFYSVLSKSQTGRKSSVGEYLWYNYKFNVQADHDYLKNDNYNTIQCSVQKKLKVIEEKIEHSYNNKSNNDVITSLNEIQFDSSIENEMIKQDCLEINKIEFTSVYENNESYKTLENAIHSQTTKNKVEIDICFLQAPKPIGSNYIDTVQNSEEWQSLRKFRVTGSRLAALIGIHGKKKFDAYWDIVKNGKTERNLFHIANIARGHKYEKNGVKYFEKVSKSTTQICGFFTHPSNKNFGASPDALGPNGILVEIKTRAKLKDETKQRPLENLDTCPAYYVQCQLQMACTDAHTCILVSYNPESDSGNCFAILRNQKLINIMLDVCDSILYNRPILSWYDGDELINEIGKSVCNKQLTYKDLKTLQAYIKNLVKKIKIVKFYDAIDDLMI